MKADGYTTIALSPECKKDLFAVKSEKQLQTSEQTIQLLIKHFRNSIPCSYNNRIALETARSNLNFPDLDTTLTRIVNSLGEVEIRVIKVDGDWNLRTAAPRLKEVPEFPHEVIFSIASVLSSPMDPPIYYLLDKSGQITELPTLPVDVMEVPIPSPQPQPQLKSMVPIATAAATVESSSKADRSKGR